jgi:hypothetical protein
MIDDTTLDTPSTVLSVKFLPQPGSFIGFIGTFLLHSEAYLPMHVMSMASLVNALLISRTPLTSVQTLKLTEPLPSTPAAMASGGGDSASIPIQATVTLSDNTLQSLQSMLTSSRSQNDTSNASASTTTTTTTTTNTTTPTCPFDFKGACILQGCSTYDWSKYPSNVLSMPDACKRQLTDYCAANTNDTYCVFLKKLNDQIQSSQ